MAKLAGTALMLAAPLGLTGCQYFFQCAKASCTNSTTGTTTNNSGDYAYVASSTNGAGSISEYNISSGALTAISGSPFSLTVTPYAMKVSPNNSFLYVGTASGGIYLYTIGSSGALTASSSTTAATTPTGLSSIDISPDGYFLYAMDASGSYLYQFSLNTSTGAMTPSSSFGVPGSAGCAASGLPGEPTSQACTVTVSPVSNGTGYVGVALGTAGTVVFPYSSSATGGITKNYTGFITPPASQGDYSLALDNSDYLYIARTAALSSYGSVNASSPTLVTGQTFANNSFIPRAVTLSRNYSYVYTANEGASTISGFSLSSGVTTSLGSDAAGPTNVSALGVDNSGTYLIAVGYNASSGVQLFKPSSGVLGSAVASAGTGTNLGVPALVALTH